MGKFFQATEEKEKSENTDYFAKIGKAFINCFEFTDWKNKLNDEAFDALNTNYAIYRIKENAEIGEMFNNFFRNYCSNKKIDIKNLFEDEASVKESENYFVQDSGETCKISAKPNKIDVQKFGEKIQKLAVVGAEFSRLFDKEINSLEDVQALIEIMRQQKEKERELDKCLEKVKEKMKKLVFLNEKLLETLRKNFSIK